MAPALTLHLRGPLRIRDGDGAPLAGVSRRGQALLAYLSRQAGMRAERALLADLLWSDRGEEQARASLRQELSALRRTLQDGLLEADRQAVWLDPSQVAVDLSDTGELLQGFDLPSEGFEDWLRAERAAQPDPSPAAAAPTRARPSVAVLAFDELGVPQSDMFADGVVEEITGALSRVHDFHVIARQSAFALRGERLDVPAAAERLGADYLVEGTVRRSGERVRIAVQLVAGEDGRTLWAERFDDRLDDLFDLQDRIAAQVAGQLSPNLRTAEIARAGTRPPEDRTAYELTLTALPHFWAHRKDDNARAIGLFDAALSRDAAYGPALAYKAWALAQQPVYMWSDDPLADREAASSIVRSAAEHAGDHPPSLVAVGAALSLVGENDEARGFIDRALKLDPNNAWGWMRRGWSSIYDRDAEAAEREFARAETLSPLDPFLFNIQFGRSVICRMLGDYDGALTLIREGMRANPGLTWAHRMIVGDLVLAGRRDEARAAAKVLLRHYPHVTVKYLQNCWPPGMTRHQPDYYEKFREAGLPEG